MTQTTLFFDYAIAGAGASGLLLALNMAEQGVLEHKTLCIIEQDANKQNDRTWCFWTTDELSQVLGKSVSHHWDEVESEGQIQALKPYTYHHVRSIDFYTQAWEELSKYKNVKSISAAIRSIESNAKGAILNLEKQVVKCAIAFNSIPQFTNKKTSEIRLWQSFYGWRIKFLSTDKIPQRLKLMDFDIEQNDSTQFVYVLPFGNNEALIELTRFGAKKLKEKKAESVLSQYLQRINTHYKIEEVEINAIPMSQQFDSKSRYHHIHQSIIPIGTAAGALKSSTGYAFLQMQKHAKDITESLLGGTALPTVYRKKRFRLYDGILLRILEKQPSKGKVIFKKLFGETPTPLVLKFLDEKTSLLEEIRIFKSLPKLLFIKNLILFVVGK